MFLWFRGHQAQPWGTDISAPEVSEYAIPVPEVSGHVIPVPEVVPERAEGWSLSVPKGGP